MAAHGAPRVAWFDRVLADIGDNQSLQQSLSTFSGHVRRIKQVGDGACDAIARACKDKCTLPLETVVCRHEEHNALLGCVFSLGRVAQ